MLRSEKLRQLSIDIENEEMQLSSYGRLGRKRETTFELRSE
jgi:hypothetical protein